jgi:hypothetical protein
VEENAVKILVDPALPAQTRPAVEEVAKEALGELARRPSCVVSVLKLRSGWTVLTTELDDEDLIESCQEALRRAGF